MPRPLMGFSFRSPRQRLPGSAELASMAGWEPPGAVWGWLPAPGQGTILPSCHRHDLFQTLFQSAEDSHTFLSAPTLHPLLRPPNSGGSGSQHSTPALLSREAASKPCPGGSCGSFPREAAEASFPELSLCPGSHPGKRHQLRSGPLGPVVGAGALPWPLTTHLPQASGLIAQL